MENFMLSPSNQRSLARDGLDLVGRDALSGIDLELASALMLVHVEAGNVSNATLATEPIEMIVAARDHEIEHARAALDHGDDLGQKRRKAHGRGVDEQIAWPAIPLARRSGRPLYAFDAELRQHVENRHRHT